MHPDDALAIARILVRRWLGKGWRVGWTRKRGIYARCHISAKRIELNRASTLRSDFVIFADTLAHEIAHGLASRAGEDGHGLLWRKLAKALGADERGYK